MDMVGIELFKTVTRGVARLYYILRDTFCELVDELMSLMSLFNKLMIVTTIHRRFLGEELNHGIDSTEKCASSRIPFREICHVNQTICMIDMLVMLPKNHVTSWHNGYGRRPLRMVRHDPDMDWDEIRSILIGDRDCSPQCNQGL